MTERMSNNQPTQSCPVCGTQLHSEGELLRCNQHGQFFRYGPRLLVAVAQRQANAAPLLPWQTLKEGKRS